MISEQMLDYLRKTVSYYMSYKRYRHTLEVEKTALILAKYCLPEKKFEISAAALLHDITKEFSLADHNRILEKYNYLLSEEDQKNPQILHSFSAPFAVKELFPEFYSDDIASAIEKHTVGDFVMTVFDEIIFLADFIEPTRSYESSVDTRDFVFRNMALGDKEHNTKILHKACIMEIDFTVSHLNRSGKTIHTKSQLAKNGLISKI